MIDNAPGRAAGVTRLPDRRSIKRPGRPRVGIHPHSPFRRSATCSLWGSRVYQKECSAPPSGVRR